MIVIHKIERLKSLILGCVKPPCTSSEVKLMIFTLKLGHIFASLTTSFHTVLHVLNILNKQPTEPLCHKLSNAPFHMIN